MYDKIYTVKLLSTGEPKLYLATDIGKVYHPGS